MRLDFPLCVRCRTNKSTSVKLSRKRDSRRSFGDRILDRFSCGFRREVGDFCADKSQESHEITACTTGNLPVNPRKHRKLPSPYRR